MIHITINGEQNQTPPQTTLTQLLKTLGYDQQWMGVAINETFIPKTAHESTLIQEGDRIEILSPIAGG